MKNIPRVKVADEAKKVINELRAKHGALMFHLSDDCSVIIEIAGR